MGRVVGHHDCCVALAGKTFAQLSGKNPQDLGILRAGTGQDELCRSSIQQI
jgi:hypothetical protein